MDESEYRDKLLNFKNRLSDQLQYLISFADRTYKPEKNTIKFTFKAQDEAHQDQLIQKRYLLLATALEVFGNDVMIEIWKLMEDGTTEYVTSTFKEDLPFGFLDENTRQINFRGGERVNHQRFGEGTVIGVSGKGFGQELTVIFKEVGAKRLLTKFANLEILR